jgi:hypothetical protein
VTAPRASTATQSRSKASSSDLPRDCRSKHERRRDFTVEMTPVGSWSAPVFADIIVSQLSKYNYFYSYETANEVGKRVHSLTEHSSSDLSEKKYRYWLRCTVKSLPAVKFTRIRDEIIPDLAKFHSVYPGSYCRRKMGKFLKLLPDLPTLMS